MLATACLLQTYVTVANIRNCSKHAVLCVNCVACSYRHNLIAPNLVVSRVNDGGWLIVSNDLKNEALIYRKKHNDDRGQNSSGNKMERVFLAYIVIRKYSTYAHHLI